ncbi:MAG: insulinase family protein [Deltaproteobacteria bacterium]|nr:insulinase family protein [Deltaproteobacteria bacterium]
MAKPARAAISPDLFPVHEHTLPNGLRVRLMPDHAVPTVSYYTFFRVGSRNERPGITGIAHLFEHMMFNGAAKYGPKEFDRVLESHGGYSNAYTSNDVTAYYEDFSSSALEKVIDLESDRMRSLAITPETLKQEREVVKEERRLRTDNDILGMLDEQLGATLYLAHPYRWPVIGWMGDIERISREDCLAFFRTYYAPNNATLFVCGDFEPNAALALIQKYYGDIPSGPEAPEVPAYEPPQKGERRAQVRYPAQASAVAMGWHAPKASDPLTPVMDVLQYALSAGEGALLTKRLVYQDELAVNVMVDYSWRIDPGAFSVYVELKPGVDPKKAEAAVDKVLQGVAEKGLASADLERAKNLLRSRALRELATHNGRAHAYGNAEVFMGDWRLALAMIDHYQAVTNAQVKAAAKSLFEAGRKNVVTLVPS